MWRYCICLVLGLTLAGGYAQASDLCWRGVCAGMTLPEVNARLEALDFTVHDNWLLRWLQRWEPSIGGVFDYEKYVERGVSATHGAKCDPDPVRRHAPCSSLDFLFVRFPSGRRRLETLSGAESVPGQQLASKLIAKLEARFGPPDRAEWTKWPKVARGTARWTLWDGHWGGWPKGGLEVKVNLVENAEAEAGHLSPRVLEESVHARSIDFFFNDQHVGFAAEFAWAGENAGWIADQRTGCRLWNNFPRPQDAETVAWDGPCVSGYANGHGVARWFKRGILSETVDGNFRKGKLNGHAVVTMNGHVAVEPSEVRFEGEFRDNRPDGYGTLKRDGEMYSGDWSKGCFAQNGKHASFFASRDTCDAF